MLEILAPAGDEACLLAALNAGADAVYFGLDVGFNARARAENLRVATLRDIMQKVHDWGRRGYLTLNTLVFDYEIPQLEALVSLAAEAGVDAVIVQDIGVARLVKAMVPSLRLHASTQMTCTDLGSIQFAESLGAVRVTLARELSLREMAILSRSTSLELEAFVHGALCIAYSGQCLTSEAIGGRSANRGACAQACRLPYDLVIDGVVRSMGDTAYLLSPRDLDASQRVPDLLASGIAAIKIEGRLKGAGYVAAATRLYRLAVDAALGTGSAPSDADRELAAQMFSRGASPGFLQGVDHQSLVDATHCDHVGIEVGAVLGVAAVGNRRWLRLRTTHRLARGDGILVQSKRTETDELGGRIWVLNEHGRDVELSDESDDLWAWLGPDRTIDADYTGRKVYRTSSVVLSRQAIQLAATPASAVAVQARLSGRFGESPELTVSTPDGRIARVTLDCQLEPARHAVVDEATIRSKLARLGDTPYRLDQFLLDIPDGAMLPMSALNRARRAAVQTLAQCAARSHQPDSRFSLDSMLVWPSRPPPPAGLYVTCRTLPQAEAALQAGADGVYLDFLTLAGLGRTLPALRASGTRFVGVALPRIRKPGEDEIDAYVRGLNPDAILLRSLGSLTTFDPHATGAIDGAKSSIPLLIADFSINITNTLSALEVLSGTIGAFTPSFDLDASQLCALLDTPLGPYAEVVIHHPMPLFHMEHCVIAALLSKGHDFHDCGRPCDTHQVSLRDRKGVDLPVEADVGCRNTVLHGTAQSAARQFPRLRSAAVRRFRIELLRESASVTHSIISCYRALLTNECAPSELRKRLDSFGVKVVEGSLRVIG